MSECNLQEGGVFAHKKRRLIHQAAFYFFRVGSVTAQRLFLLTLIFNWHYVNATAFAVEHHVTFNQSVQSVVFALADVFAWMKFVSNLSNQDVTGDDMLSTETFDTTSLGV